LRGAGISQYAHLIGPAPAKKHAALCETFWRLSEWFSELSSIHLFSFRLCHFVLFLFCLVFVSGLGCDEMAVWGFFVIALKVFFFDFLFLFPFF